MKFKNEKILWITIDLEALTISDITDDEKNELREEIKTLKSSL